MKEAILFENSALSEYRASTLPVESKKLYLLQDVLKNFHLNLEDSLITDHQYLEVSGKGQIRAEIVKEYRELINTAKPSVVTDIQTKELFESSKSSEKQQLLNLVFSNLKFDGKKLLVKLREPFLTLCAVSHQPANLRMRHSNLRPMD